MSFPSFYVLFPFSSFFCFFFPILEVFTFSSPYLPSFFRIFLPIYFILIRNLFILFLSFSFPFLLLFILSSFRGTRPVIRKCVEDNLKEVMTTSPIMNQRAFYTSMATSMAVLALPGLGYDTYRLWEVLALGSMPVLERGVGLDRTLYRLPVLLVDDFADLTPDLLRQAYVEAIYRADEVKACHFTVYSIIHSNGFFL